MRGETVWVLMYWDVDADGHGDRVTWPLLFGARASAIGWLAEHGFWPVGFRVQGREEFGRDPSGRLWALYAAEIDSAGADDAAFVVDALPEDEEDDAAS